jgi:hypothetical protein
MGVAVPHGVGGLTIGLGLALELTPGLATTVEVEGDGEGRAALTAGAVARFLGTGVGCEQPALASSRASAMAARRRSGMGA